MADKKQFQIPGIDESIEKMKILSGLLTEIHDKIEKIAKLKITVFP